MEGVVTASIPPVSGPPPQDHFRRSARTTKGVPSGRGQDRARRRHDPRAAAGAGPAAAPHRRRRGRPDPHRRAASRRPAAAHARAGQQPRRRPLGGGAGVRRAARRRLHHGRAGFGDLRRPRRRPRRPGRRRGARPGPAPRRDGRRRARPGRRARAGACGRRARTPPCSTPPTGGAPGGRPPPRRWPRSSRARSRPRSCGPRWPTTCAAPAAWWPRRRRSCCCPGVAAGLRPLLLGAGLAGRTVAVEDPGYRDPQGALADIGATARPVPVDDDGLDPTLLRDDDAAVYLTPAHQFPLGARMCVDRRCEVLDWARATGGLVLEDDYDGEFRYDVSPLPALRSLPGAAEHVVYLGTASKVLSPSLRIAWAVLPERLREPVEQRLRGHGLAVDGDRRARPGRAGAHRRAQPAPRPGVAALRGPARGAAVGARPAPARPRRRRRRRRAARGAAPARRRRRPRGVASGRCGSASASSRSPPTPPTTTAPASSSATPGSRAARPTTSSA